MIMKIEAWPSIALGSGLKFLGSGISRPFSPDNIGVPVLRSNNVCDGKINMDALRYWYLKDPRGADLSTAKPQCGDLLVNFVNGSRSELGKSAPYLGFPENCIVSTNLFILRVDESILCSEYLNCFFQSELYSQWLRKTTGFSGPGSFNQKQLRDLRIPLPPLHIQRETVSILSTWDRAIDQTEALIAAKERRKQALMQQLLTGKRRFVDSIHPDTRTARLTDWTYPRTQDIFRSVSQKQHGKECVLSVTQDQGVVARDSLGRKIATNAESTNGYKLVMPGDFVISLRSFQGGLEYAGIRGLVSPAYHVIRAIQPICGGYYRYYFKSRLFIDHLAVAIIGIRDGKQISFSDFGFMRIPMPPLEEQLRIAAVLNTCEQELRLLRGQLSALKLQKKGLMQRLLTGEVRAPMLSQEGRS